MDNKRLKDLLFNTITIIAEEWHGEEDVDVRENLAQENICTELGMNKEELEEILMGCTLFIEE